MDSISLINVSTGYGNRVVTPDMTASLRKGELTCLLGPNGAGKSTLLKTLCGFLPPVKGTVEIMGTNVKNASSAFISRNIGLVLTDRLSSLDMKVEELVSLGRTPYTGFFGTLTSSDRLIVEESMKMVGIDFLKKRKVHTLSDGERQKAMIAKALAQQTPIILLDEPTAFLDYPSKIEILRLLKSLVATEEKSIFMSTHDLDLALQMADNLWILDKNSPLRTGRPKALERKGWLNPDDVKDGITFSSILKDYLEE